MAGLDKEARHLVASCALVSNALDEILMVKTEKRGWEIPGGRMEFDETPVEAVEREVEEESGAIIEVQRLLGIYSNLTRGMVIFAYSARYVGGELQAQLGETTEVAWVKREDVLKRIPYPAMLERVSDLLAFDGRIIHRSYRIEPYESYRVSYA